MSDDRRSSELRPDLRRSGSSSPPETWRLFGSEHIGRGVIMRSQLHEGIGRDRAMVALPPLHNVDA